jgi:hypothetical protein
MTPRDQAWVDRRRTQEAAPHTCVGGREPDRDPARKGDDAPRSAAWANSHAPPLVSLLNAAVGANCVIAEGMEGNWKERRLGPPLQRVLSKNFPLAWPGHAASMSGAVLLRRAGKRDSGAYERASLRTWNASANLSGARHSMPRKRARLSKVSAENQSFRRCVPKYSSSKPILRVIACSLAGT